MLVQQGLAANLPSAQGLIMAGNVFSGGKKLDKAGQQIPEGVVLEVRSRVSPWVSRGGLKLAHGLSEFNLSTNGCICMDVGSSTGGFTDVMLANGATRVYAVDVGHGQLAWKLRSDDRVIVVEKTNARYLTSEVILDPIDFISCDVSFIGLQTLLPASLDLAIPGAHLVSLIKPQFEVARHEVGEKGVVWDSELHSAVCCKIKDWLDGLPDWTVLGLTQSPINGPEGNIEFLIAAQKS
jgi:23S rRNA (cytidine1920-2'-O)/16S rRNA (cytidine1409-2'-O)-methyltransferase